MKIVGETLAERVTSAASQLGLSQAEIAELADMPLRTYQGIAYGNSTDPSYRRVLALARVFKTTAEYLADGKSETTNNTSAEDLAGDIAQRVFEKLSRELRKDKSVSVEFLKAYQDAPDDRREVALAILRDDMTKLEAIARANAKRKGAGA